MSNPALSSKNIPTRERLIFALDVRSAEEARRPVEHHHRKEQEDDPDRLLGKVILLLRLQLPLGLLQLLAQLGVIVERQGKLSPTLLSTTLPVLVKA